MSARPSAVLAALLLLPGLLQARAALAAPLDLSRGDRVPASVANGRFTPGRPPAPYGGEAVYACPTRGVHSYVADELAELARSSKKPVPQPDGRLCAVAEAFLGWDAKEPPRVGLTAFAMQHFGILGTQGRILISMVNAPDSEPKEVASQVWEAIGNYGLNAKRARYGLMVSRVRKGSFRAVAALIDEAPVSLDAVPQRLGAGEKAIISGKLLGDFEKPRLLASDVMGALSSPDAQPGQAFRAEVACGDKPGRIQVELRGEEGGSPALVTRFPIACGTALETSAPVAAPDPWPAEPAQAARKVFEGINAERTAVGLAPLAWDDAVAGVAREIADAMRAGVERGTYEVPDDVLLRLKKVGVASPVVLQNPAQARTAEEAHQQLLASPTHRKNLMSPEVTNGGVGVVSAAGPAGSTAVLVELLIKELPPLDPVATAEKLRAAVVQRRKDGRFPAAASDPELEALAQTYAKELAAAGGSLGKARQAELTKALDKRFKTVTLTAGAKQDPLDFAEEPEVTSPGKLFGVGVALGMNEKLGRNAVYAVIMVGQERGSGKDAEADTGKKKPKKK